MNKRCTGNTCSELKTQSVEEANKCTKSAVVQEDDGGCKSTIFRYRGILPMLQRHNPADYLTGLDQLPGIAMHA